MKMNPVRHNQPSIIYNTVDNNPIIGNNPVIDIEPRPGFYEEGDPLDYPYRFIPNDHNYQPHDYQHEYHPNCMDFWWFIFGAIAVSIFLAMVEFNQDGVSFSHRKDGDNNHHEDHNNHHENHNNHHHDNTNWFKDLEFFPGTGDPIIIMLGNTFAALMFAWAAYHSYNRSNPQIIRYGSILLMVGIYIFLLAWALTLYSSHRLRTSLLSLVFALIFIVVWLVLANISRGNYIMDITLPLILGLLWVIYLIYFVTGIIVKNEDNINNKNNNTNHKNNHNNKNHRRDNKNRRRW